MATSTAQQIVGRACDELGLSEASLDPGLMGQLATQSISMLSSLGDDLASAHDWQFLEATHTITGNGVDEAFPLPADYGRIVNQTMWNTSNRMPMAGPMTPQEWGWIKFGIVSQGLIYRYRIIDDMVNIFPMPANGEEVKFFYIKKNWVRDSNGVDYKDTVENPEDVPLFDRNLMIKGLKVRLWGQKGFDTTALVGEFNDELMAQKAQNQGAPVLRLSGYRNELYLDPRRNITDGSW